MKITLDLDEDLALYLSARGEEAIQRFDITDDDFSLQLNDDDNTLLIKGKITLFVIGIDKVESLENENKETMIATINKSREKIAEYQKRIKEIELERNTETLELEAMISNEKRNIKIFSNKLKKKER